MSSESGKSVKAQELGVERIDERRFLAMLAEKGAWRFRIYLVS